MTSAYCLECDGAGAGCPAARLPLCAGLGAATGRPSRLSEKWPAWQVPQPRPGQSSWWPARCRLSRSGSARQIARASARLAASAAPARWWGAVQRLAGSAARNCRITFAACVDSAVEQRTAQRHPHPAQSVATQLARRWKAGLRGAVCADQEIRERTQRRQGRRQEASSRIAFLCTRVSARNFRPLSLRICEAEPRQQCAPSGAWRATTTSPCTHTWAT